MPRRISSSRNGHRVSHAVWVVLLVWPLVVLAARADLTLPRQFSLESHSRAIDSCDDVAELRRVAKTLLSAWHLQADMTRHYGAQAMGIAKAAL